MEKDIKELLYNKQVKDFTEEDCKYINKLENRKNSESNLIFTLIACPSAMAVGGLIGLLAFKLSIEIMMFTVSFLGLTFTPFFSAMSFINTPRLKSLGLTRKEWKELKKCGRLKELLQMVKEYKNSDYSVLNNLETSNQEIADELEKVEKWRAGLIARMAENNAKIDTTKKKIDSDDGETIDPATDINTL